MLSFLINSNDGKYRVVVTNKTFKTREVLVVFMDFNPTYLFWFLLYGVMLLCILLIHWRTHPDRREWRRIILVSVIFVIPYQIINILRITVFQLWQNNAAPFLTILGSPLETVPFAFLGAVLSLLLLRLTKNLFQKGLLWFAIAFFCALQALLSTLLGFMTWIHWNFFFSILLWIGIIGILIALELIYFKLVSERSE